MALGVYHIEKNMNRFAEEIDLVEAYSFPKDILSIRESSHLERQCGCHCRLMADEYHRLYSQRQKIPDRMKKEMTRWLLMLLKTMAEIYNMRYALP